jgi:hypothetical protein
MLSDRHLRMLYTTFLVIVLIRILIELGVPFRVRLRNPNPIRTPNLTWIRSQIILGFLSSNHKLINNPNRNLSSLNKSHNLFRKINSTKFRNPNHVRFSILITLEFLIVLSLGV